MCNIPVLHLTGLNLFELLTLGVNNSMLSHITVFVECCMIVKHFLVWFNNILFKDVCLYYKFCPCVLDTWHIEIL